MKSEVLVLVVVCSKYIVHQVIQFHAVTALTTKKQRQAETPMDKWNCNCYKGVNIQLLYKSSKSKWMEALHQNGHEYSDMSGTTTTTPLTMLLQKQSVLSVIDVNSYKWCELFNKVRYFVAIAVKVYQ